MRRVGHADPRPASRARCAPPPRCTGSALRGQSVAVASLGGRWVARGRRARGLRRRRHQAGVPSAHAVGTRGAHDDHAPVPHRAGVAAARRPRRRRQSRGAPCASVLRHDRLPAAEVVLLAHLVGHGQRVAGGTVFANTSPTVVADLVVHADGQGVRAVPLAERTRRLPSRGEGSGLVIASRSSPRGTACSGVANDRGMPDAVFRLPHDQLALFLGRLFATAGAARAAARGAGRIRYLTASRAMAQGVQHLLLRFGVAADSAREARVRGGRHPRSVRARGHRRRRHPGVLRPDRGRRARAHRSRCCRGGRAATGAVWRSARGRSGRAAAAPIDLVSARVADPSGRCSNGLPIRGRCSTARCGTRSSRSSTTAWTRCTTSPFRSRTTSSPATCSCTTPRSRSAWRRTRRSKPSGRCCSSRSRWATSSSRSACSRRKPASTRPGCATAGSSRPTGRRSATRSVASRTRRCGSTRTRTSR